MKANLTFECGSEDFRIWDRVGQDFGQCFFHLGIQFPVLSLFAIISAYYIGKRRITYSHFNEWNSCQTGIIYSRSVLVSFLTLLSLVQLAVNLQLSTHSISFPEVAIASAKTLAWLLHLVFVLRLKRGNSFNTRGPKLIVLAWFCTAVVSALELRTRYYLSKTWPDRVKVSKLRNDVNYNGFYAFNSKYNHNYGSFRDGTRNDSDDTLRDDYLWLWTSAIEMVLQGLYLLTVIPGSTHLEQRHYRHRSRMNDVVYNAHEGNENHSYTGFYEDEEELPLGTAKENANLISKLFFLWVTPMMKKGACGFLKSAESLFELPLEISTRNVALEFQRWTVRKGLTLLRSLHVCFGCEFYSVGILKLVSDAMGFCGPILLNRLVTFIENGNPTGEDEIWMGYAYCLGLFGASFIGALSNTHFNMRMAEVNLKIRAALVTTIYRKTVHMRKTTLDKYNAGEIINFMSTDTDRIVNFCPSFHAFWSLPAQVAVTLFLLYQQIGISFLAGLIFAIVLIPINKLIANKIGKLSTEMMKHKDQRVKLMSEILYGIRTLKFHSWESYFFERVNQIRKKEMNSLKGRKYLDALCVYFWASTPVLVSVLSFSAYVLLGNELTAARVFTSIALFNMLISPLNALPWVLNGVVEAWVSIKRINKFLQEEETEPKDIYASLPTMMKEDTALLADGCSFDWGTDSLKLEDLNLKILKGQFIGIIGNVGAGKSSVLLSLLGELNKSEGFLSVPDPNEGIGVVLQEAWIQRGTIRSNICFTPNTNLTRYKSVIDCCCLKEDLDSFKWRDDTIVGENGLSLSGGQKIRLTLSRAVYQDFNMYFLDDIFAAVDYKVAKALYHKCIMGILKKKTRILCTHHTQFLQDADWILVLDNGRVKAQGTAKEILAEYGQNDPEELSSTSSKTTEIYESGESSSGRKKCWSSKLHVDKDGVPVTPSEEEIHPMMTKSSQSFELTNGAGNEESCDTNEETQQEGIIQFHVFRSYYKAIGPTLFWMILVSISLMQLTRNMSDIWLAFWISKMSNSSDSGNGSWTTTTIPFPTFETFVDQNDSSVTESIVIPNTFLRSGSGEDSDYFDDRESSQEFGYGGKAEEWIGGMIPWIVDLDPEVRFYFGIFILIGLLNSVFTLFRAFLFALGGILGALRIHSSLLKSILKAKMSFFDMTPIGRILNRFSSDVATVDDSLPFISNILLAQTFGLIGTLALTCYALPWILVVIIPLLLICSNIQEYYRHTARQLRRLGSISLSPVYAHFSETLKGLVVIRSMRAIRRFEEINESHLESSQKCQYSSQLVSQWLGFRLQMVGVVIVTSVGLLGIFQHHYGTADPGIIGLAISYALTVTSALNGFVTVLTETEKEMVSVERACEYIEEVCGEEESQREQNVGSVPYLWPAQGVIQFLNVSLRYRENLPYVLRRVSFETRPTEKIGICGRTGSGKSSLFAALFRMVDHFEGDIFVDHVSTKFICLKELRSKMCIIPQDPLIFSGTLRENLDPLEERNDDDIIRALDKCQLRSVVRQLGGLYSSVGDNGNLLSTGQKQLVCLARALLINAKILCIDEATANVNLETDKVIQATLRTSFSQTTVITVAHRVNTILHCDRVIVMSQGELVEFDDPGKLMQQQDSQFYQLARGNL